LSGYESDEKSFNHERRKIGVKTYATSEIIGSGLELMARLRSISSRPRPEKQQQREENKLTKYKKRLKQQKHKKNHLLMMPVSQAQIFQEDE
jgi:hypothetical protein